MKRRKYKSIITRRIWKSARKLGAAFLVLSLFSSVVAMRGTNAGFLDEEKSEGNSLAATTLDFSVSSAGNFLPKVSPSKETLRSGSISKAGIADFKYRVSAGNFSGNVSLCEKMKIKDDLDNTYKTLSSYISSGTDNLTKTAWNFTVKLTDNDQSLADKICNFDLKFEAWQTDLAYGAGGFTDVETLSSQVNSEHWTNIADHLVVNEVYYDVASGKGADGDNEWVEIYNPTASAVNLKNWKICDNSVSCDNLASSDLEIPANGYAVVTNSATTWGYWTIPGSAMKIALGNNIGNGLANDGDRVILKNDSEIEIDAMSYGDDTSKLNPACPDVAEGHSLARKPAGQDLNINSDFENLTSPNPGTNPHTIVMNEIMPDPVGEDDASMPGGEWIELYNYGKYDIDLKDWVLKDKDGNTLQIKDSNTGSESTVIAGGEILVIYRNGNKDFDLNNDGDEVRLIDEKGLLKDSYAWSETLEGKSIARFPDAVGPWIDPEATPGEENKLSGEEADAFRMAAFEKCFDGKEKLKKNNRTEVCALEFLKYLGMIKELDDKKIDDAMLINVLGIKKANEEKRLADLLKKTQEIPVEQDVPANDENPIVAPDTATENPEVAPIDPISPEPASSEIITPAVIDEPVVDEPVVKPEENITPEIKNEEIVPEVKEPEEPKEETPKADANI